MTTIERPPSAELRADQRDDQSLPPYDVLDRVLEAYVELDRSREELLAEFDGRRGRANARARRPRRVQAPPGTARREAPPTGLRPRLAHADHEPLARLGVGEPLPPATPSFRRPPHQPHTASQAAKPPSGPCMIG